MAPQPNTTTSVGPVKRDSFITSPWKYITHPTPIIFSEQGKLAQDALLTHYYLSMDMDAIQIVLRTPKCFSELALFAITIPDDEASAVRTVGDFYRLICSKLSLVPLPSPTTSPLFR